MRTIVAALVLLSLAVALAQAHGEAVHERAEWTFDPWILTPLLVSASLYAAGVFVLWRRAGWGRGIQPWQAAAYTVGWLALAAALVSPLHWLGEHLFTFHMIEHEIVMVLAAPLIAAARPLGALLWGLPKRLRISLGLLLRTRLAAQLWRFLTRPLNATVLHGVAIWIWHAPHLFDAAVTDISMHRLQHLSFLLTALLFWWSLIRRADYGVAVGHLFVTMLHTSILGALMALAPRVLYQAQTAEALHWGLTPLEDQQLAGVMMWVPAGTVYAGAALAFATLWISRSDKPVGSGHTVAEGAP
jgi:cytochrome c oxidase assembly factor CtaG